MKFRTTLQNLIGSLQRLTILVFLDANIPMYAGGDAHPLKAPSIRILSMAAATPEYFATSAEVFQEIMHRFISLRRWSLGRKIISDFADLMNGRIEAVYAADIEIASALADRHDDVPARDLVHAAVMHRLGISRIVSADTEFDEIDGIERLDPMLVDEWAETVASES